MTISEQEPRVGVSQMLFGVRPTVLAFRGAQEINNKLGLEQPLGMEMVVDRFATAGIYQWLSEHFHVPVMSLHDVVFPYVRDYLKWSVENIKDNPREAAFELLLLAGFGGKFEPFKLYGEIETLVQKLHVPIVAHFEVLEALVEKDPEYLERMVKIVQICQELGWGLDQGRPKEKSWHPDVASGFAQERGLHMVIDTSTVALVGRFTNRQVWEKLGPLGKNIVKELHVSDYGPNQEGKPVENLPLGVGLIGSEVRDIVLDALEHDIQIIFESRCQKGESPYDVTARNIGYLHGEDPQPRFHSIPVK